MHEVTEACMHAHCTFHQEDEPGKGYLTCFECGHLFKTRKDLRKRWRQAHREMFESLEGRPWLSNDWMTGRLRYWWMSLTLRVDKIYSCPFCAHDF